MFRYLVGERSLGADVSWLSQFEGEKEMLFGPMTHMQVVPRNVNIRLPPKGNSNSHGARPVY